MKSHYYRFGKRYGCETFYIKSAHNQHPFLSNTNMSLPTEIHQIILKNAPLKDVNLKLGEADSTFEIVTKPFNADDVKEGQVVVKLKLISNDPTQRGWIQKGLDPRRMYVAPVLEGDRMMAVGLAEVVLSKNDTYKEGDLVLAMVGWGDYAVLNAEQVRLKINAQPGVPLLAYLSALGMTGLTAYFGTIKVGQLQAGQTIIVSAASGATGLMVVQVAKHIVGAKRVIGFAGSDEKCKLVELLGADKCINYKLASDLRAELDKALDGEFADVYYDNVGGEILDLCLSRVKQFGRVVACGAISGYNDHLKMAVTRWGEIITNRLTVQGFIVMDFAKDFPEGLAALAKGLMEGKIKDELEVVDIKGDLTKIPEVWHRLFDGKGPGKLITKP